ncbi:MAG: rhodanese-like domain-containing protein, partial [Thermoplasmata archaeon]
MEKVGMKVVLCISLIFILSTAVKNCDRKEEIDAWFISLSPEEAKQMIESNQNIVVFDVRTVDEYNAGHIKEAIPMPLSKFLCKSCLQSILDSYKDKEIILYSNNGTLSKKVLDILQRNGFQFVYNINGGL